MLFWASRKNQLVECMSVLLVQLRICLSVTSTTLYSGSGAMNQSTALAGYVSLRWTGMLMVKGHGSSWNAPTGASSVQLGGVGLEGNLNDVSVWWTAHCDFEGIQMRKGGLAVRRIPGTVMVLALREGLKSVMT